MFGITKRMEQKSDSKAKEMRKETDKKLRDIDNKKRGKKGKKKPAPKNTHQFIGYEKMYEDGLCLVEDDLYSRSICFSDINYKTARKDDQVEIFSSYCELLNYFDPSMHCQISIINKRIDGDDFKSKMFLDMQGDVLDVYRKEMNEMLTEKALQGQNSIVKEKILTFSTTADSHNAAVRDLARVENDITSHFKNMDCATEEMDGKDRLRTIHEVFRPGEKFEFSYKEQILNNLTTKSVIAPPSFDFKQKDYFMFGEHYGQVLLLTGLPAELSDKLLTEISDLPIDLVITFHIDNIDQGEALEYVKSQIAYMEQEATKKQDEAVSKNRNTAIAIPMETRKSHEEAFRLLEDLEDKNQRMFKGTLFVFTHAKDYETLHDNVYQIQATARKNGVKIDTLDYRQREGINSILALGKNHVDTKRTLTTAQTAIFVPFTTQELTMDGGMYYGMNALSRNLVMLDRKQLFAPNGVVLGTPGSGKSFASKREMVNVLLSDPNSEVIIIDPEREYTNLAYGFDGEVIHISSGSKMHINPMDINADYADDDDPIMLKSEYVSSLCELLVGGRQGLSPTQKTVIDRVTIAIYQNYFNHPGTEMPTLKTFHAELMKQDEPEAKNIALALELYTKGSLSVFSNPTNVDITKRLVVYDIRDLGKQLRAMGILIVLDNIWNRITENRAKGRRTWIYIDEFQLLLQNEHSQEYFFQLWSRARKWGAIPTAITQNMETLLLSDAARRMFSNSDYVMLLKQSPSDRKRLADLLKISDKQMSYVTNSEPGNGLLFAGKNCIPFIDKFPKDTKLYQMMTTKIEELTGQEEVKVWKV